jgi:hypothetical protein
MAGIKITDLTTLGEAASDDLLYIVDVSDNTQSPQGTSKQIEVGKMFSSGTYTPTITEEVTLSVTPNAATYIQVGSIVSCSIQLGIVFDALENSGSFELSLPIASSFTSSKELNGILQWSYIGDMFEIAALTIGAETTNNTCQIQLEVINDQASLLYVTLQLQYQIL